MSNKILDLRQCDFRGKDLSGKTLSGGLLSDSDLTGANLQVGRSAGQSSLAAEAALPLRWGGTAAALRCRPAGLTRTLLWRGALRCAGGCDEQGLRSERHLQG